MEVVRWQKMRKYQQNRWCGTSGGRPGASTVPRRKSGSCWRDCGARTASRSCAGGKASTRTCTTSGAKNSSKQARDRKSTRLNSSHVKISYAVFCLKKKKRKNE